MDRFDSSPYLRGEVININDPLCPPVDKILVDTNVLYFFYYDRFSQLAAFDEGPKDYQIIKYPAFLKKLLSSQAVLFVHEIGLLEFTSIVSNAELRLLYYKLNNTPKLPDNFRYKDFCCAHPKEYFSIQRNLQTYLHTIMKSFKLLGQDISIDSFLVNFLHKWQDSLTGVADAIMFAEAERQGVYSILSDDALIATIEDIILYTANDRAIVAYKEKQSSYVQTDPET